MGSEFRRALTAAWLVVSLVGLVAVAALHGFPGELLLSVGARLQLDAHGQDPCLLCGMTRGLVAVRDGEIRQALEWNRASLVFYVGAVVNGLVALVFAVGKLREFRGASPCLTVTTGPCRSADE